MRRHGGFTLIEVMIVVAVIALLAAIAYPSYQRYAMRAKRSEAQQLMTEITSKETQYILDARTYTETLGAAGLNINRQGWTCAATCTTPAYTISVAVDNAATPPTFTITGTPAGQQSEDGVLSLDSTGARSRMISGTDQGW